MLGCCYHPLSHLLRRLAKVDENGDGLLEKKLRLIFNRIANETKRRVGCDTRRADEDK